MLDAVGHAFVVNPDRGLRRMATERGWETLTFVRPVALRTGFPPPRQSVPVLGVAALAVVGFFLVRRWRRRAR